jgi:hypothetical protein
MTRTDHYRKLAACLAALLAAGLALLVAEPGVHGLDCGSSWSTVPSASELHNPRAIAAIAKNDMWVVGNRAARAGVITTGAEHWNGSSWSLSPTPNIGTGHNALNGVDASASNDVWAVGYSEHGGGYKTLIEHWDGGNWSVVTSPNVGSNPNNTLTGVDALSRTNAWAVGSYRTATSRKTLIQRWNGTSWQRVSSPNPSTLSNSLLGVAAVGPKDIWAVGWKSTSNGLRSLILRRNGTSWKEVAVPKVGTGDNVLTDISTASANDVWATGYYVDGAQYKTLTLHYNGSTWSHVPSRNGVDGTSILRGIGAFSSTNTWAVGFSYRADLHRYVAATQRWDGSSWSAFPSAISSNGTTDSEMLSVAKAPDTSQVWAISRPADVETICPSGSLTATAPAQEATGTPTRSSAQAPTEQPSSVPAESSVSSTSVAPTSSGIPVIAVDKAVDAGISETTQTHGAVIADFNNDQRPDIFLGRHLVGARLYNNDGNGHFTEVNQGTFVSGDRHGCNAADVNGDGLKDIFCTQGAIHGTLAKRNELYIQRPDHTFAEEAGNYGVFDPFGRGRFSAFIDANGDPHPDLFVANQVERGDAMPSLNRFFINQGGSTYRQAPEYGLERETSLWTAEASVGDLDKDGWEDLVLTAPSGLRVYHNDQGRGFTDVAASVGLGQSARAVTLADVNGDSWLDMIEVSSNELRVLLNTNGTFSSAFSTTLADGHSVAAGDVNGDNRPDIYVMRGRHSSGVNPPDLVYLNDGNGTSFTQMSSIPSASEGAPDFVAPIDYDQNGLTDFLVLNGAGTETVTKGGRCN